MLEQLKQDVLRANLLLPARGLVSFTWGNVSGIDRERGIVVIKPSGVSYDDMSAEDMVAVELDSGRVVEGRLRPSSDTPTHLELYRAFPNIGGVVHTHSRWATVFAQAGRSIPVLGTTHADSFYGSVPCTGPMSNDEVNGEYERETGRVIAKTFERLYPGEPDMRLDPNTVSAVLVYGHGPFCWGADPISAVHTAAVLEEVAFMAWHTLALEPDAAGITRALLDRHFLRKHGDGAYYGQR